MSTSYDMSFQTPGVITLNNSLQNDREAIENADNTEYIDITNFMNQSQAKDSKVKQITTAITKPALDTGSKFLQSVLLGMVMFLFHMRTAIIKMFRWQAIASLYALETIIVLVIIQIKAVSRMIPVEKNEKDVTENPEKVNLSSIGVLNSLYWSSYSLQTTKGLKDIVISDAKLFDNDSLAQFIKQEFHFWRDKNPTEEQQSAPNSAHEPLFRTKTQTPPASAEEKPSRVGRLIHRRQKHRGKALKMMPKNGTARYNIWYDSKDLQNRASARSKTVKADASGEFSGQTSSTIFQTSLNEITKEKKSGAFSPVSSRVELQKNES